MQYKLTDYGRRVSRMNNEELSSELDRIEKRLRWNGCLWFFTTGMLIGMMFVLAVFSEDLLFWTCPLMMIALFRKDLMTVEY